MLRFHHIEDNQYYFKEIQKHLAKALEYFGAIKVQSEFIQKNFAMFNIETCKDLIDLHQKIFKTSMGGIVKEKINLFEMRYALLADILEQGHEWMLERDRSKEETLTFLLLWHLSLTFDAMLMLRHQLSEHDVISEPMRLRVYKAQLKKTHTAFVEFNEKLEMVCGYTLNQNPLCLKLKKELMKRYHAYDITYQSDTFSPDALNRLIQMKNARSARFDLPYNGMLISNASSPYAYRVDPKCFKKLLKVINRVKEGQQGRTQIVYYISGQPKFHATALDIQYDKSKQEVQIICFDSSEMSSVFRLVEKLSKVLAASSIKYQIIACQALTQRDIANCAHMSYIATGFLSKLSFNKLMQAEKMDVPQKFLVVDLDFKPRALKNVLWLDASAFGLKAIQSAQSIDMITENLAKLSLNPRKTVARLTNKYELDRANKIYVPEQKAASHRAKLKGKPFEGMTSESVLARAETKDLAQALRRAAAGLLRCRDLEYLLDQMRAGQLENVIDTKDKGAKGYTPLHVALSRNKVKQSCLLLAYGAKTDVPANDKKTPKKLFEESKALQGNTYLRNKFKS